MQMSPYGKTEKHHVLTLNLYPLDNVRAPVELGYL